MSLLKQYAIASENYQIIYQALQVATKPYDISPTEAILLSLLTDGTPKSCTQLADIMKVTLPRVSTLSDKLAALKYVKRYKSKEDKRVHMLEITDLGREVLAGLE